MTEKLNSDGEWSNWSGSLRFRPARIEFPRDEQQALATVRSALDEGRGIRPIGSGHSSSRIVPTPDVLVSLDKLSGIESVDAANQTAWVKAGTKLEDLGKQLLEHQFAMPNLGDVDQQSLAGALSTGTHGTGRSLKIVAGALVGVRLIDGQGELQEFAEPRDADTVRAARVSLGALGLFTAIKLQLVPAFKLRLRQWCTHVDDCLAHLNELVAQHRNFDFYWYPRRDETKLRTWNPPGEGPEDLPFARCLSDETDWSASILPQHSQIDRKFEETEYAVPAAAGLECFREVRERIKLRHRKWVCWRVLYRTIAGDDAYLSHSYGGPTVTISLHQNASLPYEEYFRDLEPILAAHGGRPHWGKKYSLTAAELRPRYPAWEQFGEVRRRLDPQGVFLNDHLRQLFID